MALQFLKMHGLGNDFVMLDARGADGVAEGLTPDLVRAIGDRHRGVGFDQLIVLRDSATHDARLDFWNADGSTAGACGNGTRCAAHLLMKDAPVRLLTERGCLIAEPAELGRISVNMGAPQLTWDAVPLARDMPLDPLPLEGAPAAVGMGNPHCVFFVDDVEAVNLAVHGPRFEHDPLFPQRTNVEVVQVLDRETLRMRVWERGGFITLACGSGACAVAVASALRGLTERKVTIHLDGGPLDIDWREDGVWMTGPTTTVFEGTFSDAFLESAR